MMNKKFGFIVATLFVLSHTIQADNFTRIRRANRRLNAKGLRVNSATGWSKQCLEKQPTNGDEDVCNPIANFGKSIAHLDNGLVDPTAYQKMVFALQTGDPCDFLNIPMGVTPATCKLIDPQASLAFNLIGADSWIHCFPAPPKLCSAETAGEMVELYGHALLRDVPFNEYDTPATASVISALNMLSDFKGPKQNGVVNAQTLFRGTTPGDLVGPYISQFLYLPVPYGPGPNFNGSFDPTAGITYQAQVVPTAGPQNNFMTNFDEWFLVQKGAAENNCGYGSIEYDTDGDYAVRMFIRNGRDLGDYVHQDSPPMPYVNAAFILLGFGAKALDPANPYIDNPTQEGFVTYNNPDICYLVSVAAEMALRAAWYFKWQVHRRLRPEVTGFYVNQQKNNVQDFCLNSEVIDSPLLADVEYMFGSYFLPLAYPEGSPRHPAYPAGHAVVAGACTTILKAFFNEAFEIPAPVEPNAANDELVTYYGTLTVGDELNKLASNIAIGRNTAGVHYRSDGTEGILLGEKVALAILNDEAYCRNIPFNGYSLTKFDGTKITVGGKRPFPEY